MAKTAAYVAYNFVSWRNFRTHLHHIEVKTLEQGC